MHPPVHRRLPGCIATLLGLWLCTAAAAAELTISAAASLNNAFRDLQAPFEARHRGIRLRFNFGASGALLQQIAKGAPADVFASADTETMDQAQAWSLVHGAQRRNFASNTLVVVVPVPAPGEAGRPVPRSLADLLQPAYARVAIGLPASVPAGRYARRALEQAGQWAAMEPRVIGAQNVRQALDYVARGEVDAGFVYATDAVLMNGKVQVALAVPTPEPILYPVAPVAASTMGEAAQAFVAFVTSPPAQAVLARHGFGKP